MIKSLKRLFSRQGQGQGQRRDLSGLERWAKRRGHGFKRVRDEDGFVIDGLLEGRPWRIEWGPPQRDYIAGHELRLRMELNLPFDAQMLVLSRPLMDSLERQTFEEFTDNVQTQIGTKTPEEMRWLVVFSKVSLVSLKALRTHFGAVANVPATGLAWLEGPLANMLEHAASEWLRDGQPFVLMTLRGRAYLRMQMATPEPESVAAALALFETAVAQALRVAGDHIDRDADSGVRSTAWQSFPPDDREPPNRR